MFQARQVAWLLGAVLGATPAGPGARGEAGAGVEMQAPYALETVSVVSTRTVRPVDGVVGMVSVLDYSDIEQAMATDPEGLWRYLPAVEVDSAGTRFGARSLSIRGLGGNRVLTEVDGVPVQDRFVVGSFADAARDGASLDFVRRIEVLRGPASALYGSSAIGGVVAITTFAPRDFSAGPGQPGGRLKTGIGGADASWHASAIGAWEAPGLGLLVAGSRRNGEAPDRSADPDNPDRARTAQNAILARVVLGGAEDWTLGLVLDAREDEARTELDSLLGSGRFAATTSLLGDDEARRRSGAVDWQWEQGGLAAYATLFHARTETRQETVDLRELLPSPTRIEREFSFDTRASGIRARVVRELQGEQWRHRVTLGAEHARRELQELRDGRQVTLATGATSNVVLGETFPLRDIPVTTADTSGLFLQDEIDAVSGKWAVIPALRFDRSRIRARDDAGWRAANPTIAPASLDASDVSPRLGVLWRPAGEVQAWAQWSTGFRAPPPEDLNVGLDIPMFRIRALPNPDLKSETSRAWEAGLRWQDGAARLALAAFHTDYRDFIVPLVPLGPEPGTGVLLFQAQNVERARIRGVELEGAVPLGTLPSSSGRLSAGFSAWWAEGESRVDGSALPGVGPPSAVVFLDWSDPSGRHQARLAGLFARGQALAGTAAAPGFRVPGYGVFDLVYAWQVSDRLSLQAGVFNLLDRTWWRWGAMRDLPADDPLVPALSAPGRSISLSARLALGAG